MVDVLSSHLISFSQQNAMPIMIYGIRSLAIMTNKLVDGHIKKMILLVESKYIACYSENWSC